MSTELTPEAEALRERLTLAEDESFLGPESIARTIVEQLGITEEMIDAMRHRASLDSAESTSDWEDTWMFKHIQALSALWELANYGE